MINTTISKQLEIIRKISKDKISVIYHKKFLLKFTVSITEDKKWFEKQLSQIELLYALIETSVMGANPRKALRYLCIMNSLIEQLVKYADCAYALKLEKKY